MALPGSYAGEVKKQGVSQSRDIFLSSPIWQWSTRMPGELLVPSSHWRVKLDSDVRKGGGSRGRSRGDALTETQERQADSDPLRPLFIWVTFWQMLPPLTGCHHKGGSFPFSQSWRIILKDWFRNMSLTTKFHHHNHTVTITISHLTWLHLEHKIPGNLEQVFATKWKHVFLQCR